MASVLMKRGNTSTMQNTPNQNGLIFFNTDDKCIYLDDGTNRTIFGGQVQRITDIALASNNNVFTSQATVNYFIQKTNVADNANNIINNTQVNRPVGCTGFKEIVGTDDISNVGSTVKNSIVKLDDRLKTNDTTFYFDYQGGQWGFNTSEERGADTFHPFNSTQIKSYFIRQGSYKTNPLNGLSVGLTVASTAAGSCKALPINLVYGTSAVTYASSRNTSKYVEGYSGDVIHIFNDGIGSGNLSSYGNQHYVCYKRGDTVTTCTAVTPLYSYKSTATIGMPFTIKKLQQSGLYHYRNDDLYYYLCNNNTVKIYKYVVGGSSAYKDGSWSEQSNARLELATEGSGITKYQIGDRNKIVVYHNELYIFGGSYILNGTKYTDNRIFIWNPTTQQWRFVSDVPAHVWQSQYFLVNNDMLCAVYLYDSGDESDGIEAIYCNRFNGTTWEDEVAFTGVFHYYTIKNKDVGVCVDYNGEIHFLSDKQHYAFNFLASSTENGIRQYANIAFSMKNGCACTAIPFDTQKLNMNEKQVEELPKLIHYFSTTTANSDSAAIRKYHRTLQDTYYLGLNDTDNQSFIIEG